MKQSKHFSKKLAALVAGGLFSLSFASASAAETRSLALSESVELALENNRSIKSSVTDVDAADWAYHEARRTAGPKLTLSTMLFGAARRFPSRSTRAAASSAASRRRATA